MQQSVRNAAALYHTPNLQAQQTGDTHEETNILPKSGMSGDEGPTELLDEILRMTLPFLTAR